MAGEERVNMSTWNSRLNYFDGLFLKAEDFTLEQFFHLMARRYLNYLLFNPGRLYTADGTMPLEVTASGTTITVSSGTALVRYDGAADNRAGHEVHLETSVDLNLATSTYGFSVGDTVYVRIDYLETEEIVGTGGGGAGVLVASANQVREQAVIKLSTVPPDDLPPYDYSVLLATVDYQAAMTNSNVTNDETRGGIRYEILSSDLLSKIGGVGPSPALTGITIDVTGPLALSLGASQNLSATGTFSDSSSRPLTVAGDGLVWSSDDDTVVSVTAGGTITAAGPGSADITAEAGGQSATITVNVVSLVDFTISPAGPLSLTVGDTDTLVSTGQFSDSSTRVLTAGDGLSWSSENNSVATVSSGGLVTAVSEGSAMITATIDTISHAVSVTIIPTIPTPELLYSIPGEPTLPFDPNGGYSGDSVQIFGRNFVDPVVQIVELGPDSESTTDDTVLNTFNVGRIYNLSSGGIDYQRINATVGEDISTDQVGRLRVINDNGRAGNVTSTLNFVLRRTRR